MLTKAGVPLVAPFSGAQAIREPLNPLVFHLRASYQQEAGKIITYLAKQGTTRSGIFYQDDEFGRDGLAGYEKYVKAWKLAAPVVAKDDRKTLDIDAAAQAMAKPTPEAVVMYAEGPREPRQEDEEPGLETAVLHAVQRQFR